MQSSKRWNKMCCHGFGCRAPIESNYWVDKLVCMRSCLSRSKRFVISALSFGQSAWMATDVSSQNFIIFRFLFFSSFFHFVWVQSIHDNYQWRLWHENVRGWVMLMMASARGRRLLPSFSYAPSNFRQHFISCHVILLPFYWLSLLCVAGTHF